MDVSSNYDRLRPSCNLETFPMYEDLTVTREEMTPRHVNIIDSTAMIL